MQGIFFEYSSSIFKKGFGESSKIVHLQPELPDRIVVVHQILALIALVRIQVG